MHDGDAIKLLEASWNGTNAEAAGRTKAKNHGIAGTAKPGKLTIQGHASMRFGYSSRRRSGQPHPQRLEKPRACGKAIFVGTDG
jgi:hypothetical protein